MVIFFSCVINVLYYVGAMQFVISKIGYVLCKVLRTTAPESLCAAANIFVGLVRICWQVLMVVHSNLFIAVHYNMVLDITWFKDGPQKCCIQTKMYRL